MSIINYYRLNTLKEYKTRTFNDYPQQVIDDFENKIKCICELDGCSPTDTTNLMDLEGLEPNPCKHYLNYLFYRHMFAMVNYINAKLPEALPNIPENIRVILDEIINGEVDESYYENTVGIYGDIAGCDEDDCYPVIDQAIRLNNIKLLYYIYFLEEGRIEAAFEDAMGEGVIINP